MKLKEKLAKEYSEKLCESLALRTAAKIDFLAGFEKAREMAKQKCYDVQVEPDDDHSRDIEDRQYNLGCMECQVSIATLGEEEVE